MDPDQIDFVLDEANRLLEAGKPGESLQRLDALVDHLVDSDDRIECAALRAYALSEVGRSKEAVRALEPLLTEFPESARLHGAMGVVLSGANDLERARRALETAVALDSQDESLLANLALIYERLRDFRTALRLYSRALNLGADLDWALQRKAAALIELGDHAAAKATLRRYLSLVPEDAEQWVALGILHSDADEHAEAYACYRQAEQVSPDSPTLRLNWGVTAVRAGHLKVAQRQLRLLQRIEPESTRPLLLRAFLLEESGDVKAARGVYEDVVGRVGPGNSAELTYAFEMAMDFYARQGMRVECDALLRRAYHANACTVELCEAYRDVAGAHLGRAYWFSLVVEGDYRDGLIAVMAEERSGQRVPLRFQRTFQCIARDHDEALELVMRFVRQMGETNVTMREFIAEESVEHTHVGIYEVERESLVLSVS